MRETKFGHFNYFCKKCGQEFYVELKGAALAKEMSERTELMMEFSTPREFKDNCRNCVITASVETNLLSAETDLSADAVKFTFPTITIDFQGKDLEVVPFVAVQVGINKYTSFMVKETNKKLETVWTSGFRKGIRCALLVSAVVSSIGFIFYYLGVELPYIISFLFLVLASAIRMAHPKYK